MFRVGSIVQLKGENEPWLFLGIRDGKAICRRYQADRGTCVKIGMREEFAIETLEPYVEPKPAPQPILIPLPGFMNPMMMWWWV
jgi:hypothetical protein